MAGVSECILCSAGRYSTAEGVINDSSCDLCTVGRYSVAGSTMCTDCPAGTVGNKEGLSACVLCQLGKYGEFGATECFDCLADTYAPSKGLKECTTCPNGKSTDNARGSSACFSPSDSISTNLSEDNVYRMFSTGTAYVLTILLCGLYAGFGFFIHSLRSKNARLVNLTVPQIEIKMVLSAASLMSEIFLLSIMFVEGNNFTGLGTTILLFRIFNCIPSMMFIGAVFGGSFVESFSSLSAMAKPYKDYLDREHFMQFVYPYAGVSLLCLFDCTLLSILPWQFSEFSQVAQGFPTLICLRIASVYKITADLVRFICNIVYLSEAKGKASDASIEVMTVFNILFSLASIILSLLVVLVKSSVLKDIEVRGGGVVTDTDKSEKRESVVTVELESGLRHTDTTEETMTYKNNPLASGSASASIQPNLSSTPSQSETSNPLHSTITHDATTDSDFPLSGVTTSTPARTWLVRLISELDAPSVHAVDQAFQEDGIHTCGDLVDFIQGGVLSSQEIVQYAKKAKISKAHTLKMVEALKPLFNTSQI